MRYIAIAAALLVAACDQPHPQVVGYRNGYFVYADQAQPTGAVDPTTLLLLSRMNQPTYQPAPPVQPLPMPVTCNRLGNQTTCW